MLEEQRGAHAVVSRCRIGGLGGGSDIALRSSWGVFVWHLAKLKLRNSTVDDCEFVGVRIWIYVCMYMVGVSAYVCMYACMYVCMYMKDDCELVGVSAYVCMYVCMHVHSGSYVCGG